MSELETSEMQQILDLISITQSAAIELHKACNINERSAFETLSDDIHMVYQTITPLIKNSSKIRGLSLTCESIVDSLKRIVALFLFDRVKCSHKIEYELLPLIEIIYMNFYFYEIASKDEELLKQYLEQDRFSLGANSYIDDSEEAGIYKYDISICILAFNKLDYTKLCVESLLKHIPKGLSYELILTNHGSTDDTKSYFESIAPHKQLDILKNGGGFEAIMKIPEGQYILSISNDILVTENAIENMLACIKSDPLIAYVVPSTPNISNLQAIPANYTSIDEMYEFAAKNNQQNPLKWEQRTRLCDPIAMLSSKHILSSEGILPYTHKITGDDTFIFPDDKLAYFLRKKGLKMMLAKDAYCYHFGQVTIKDEVQSNDFYMNGRIAFHKTLKIDPWGKGFCYDFALFQNFNIQQKNDANILGVSSGMGSNPLKIKTLLRELGSKNTKLFLVTEEEHFQADYESYTESSHIEIVPISKFSVAFPEEKFDYIIVEAHLSHSDVNSFKNRLRTAGKLLVWCANSEVIDSLQKSEFLETIPSNNGAWYIYS